MTLACDKVASKLCEAISMIENMSSPSVNDPDKLCRYSGCSQFCNAKLQKQGSLSHSKGLLYKLYSSKQDWSIHQQGGEPNWNLTFRTWTPRLTGTNRSQCKWRNACVGPVPGWCFSQCLVFTDTLGILLKGQCLCSLKLPLYLQPVGIWIIIIICMPAPSLTPLDKQIQQVVCNKTVTIPQESLTKAVRCNISDIGNPEVGSLKV